MRMYTKLNEVREEKETERLEDAEVLDKKKLSVIKSQSYQAYESPNVHHERGHSETATT